METCGNDNGNSVVINGKDIVSNWVLCPVVTATATTKISFVFAAVSMNEPLVVMLLATYFTVTTFHVCSVSNTITIYNFPDRGRQPHRGTPTYYLVNFFRKMYAN